MKILYYTGFFRRPLSEAEGFDPALAVGVCEVLLDPMSLSEADVVVFHLPNLKNRFLPRKRKGQLWVALSVEADQNYPLQGDAGFMAHFDIRMLLRQDCEIPLAYFRPKALPLLRLKPKWKYRRTPVVYFGSNEKCRNDRTFLLNEIENQIDVHWYGRGARRCWQDKGRKTKLQVISRYLFCLAFENCNQEDYVSEKVYDALLAGTVPIYFGASNVDDYLPSSKSIINVRDFKDPAELVAYLLELRQDRQLYDEHLKWKQLPFSPKFIRLAEQQASPSLLRLHAKVSEMKLPRSQQASAGHNAYV